MLDNKQNIQKDTGVKGLLLLYVVLLVYLLVHGLGLTIASIVTYNNHTDVGTHGLISLNSLLIYVVTNLILAIYTVIILVLIFKKRRAAIINNYVFSVLSILCLVWWHSFGAKSTIGTFIDSLPGIVGIVYFLRSKRVKNTLVL
jgi:Protein of unknown function (DUF2569)